MIKIRYDLGDLLFKSDALGLVTYILLGGRVTPYNGLYGDAPPERGNVF